MSMEVVELFPRHILEGELEPVERVDDLPMLQLPRGGSGERRPFRQSEVSDSKPW